MKEFPPSSLRCWLVGLPLPPAPFSFKFDNISCSPIVRQSIQKSRHLTWILHIARSGIARLKSHNITNIQTGLWVCGEIKTEIQNKARDLLLKINSLFLLQLNTGGVAIHNSTGEQEVFLVFLLKIVDRRSTLSPSPPLIVILLLPPPSCQFNYSSLNPPAEICAALKSLWQMRTNSTQSLFSAALAHHLSNHRKHLWERMTPLCRQMGKKYRGPGCVNSPNCLVFTLEG